MTAQRAEKLIVEKAGVDFGQRLLYGILVGDSAEDYRRWTPYAFTTQGNESKMVICSALWRGYVSTYVLNEAGELHLVKLDYLLGGDDQSEVVNEKLQGRFWLDLRPRFFSESLLVPFEEGLLVNNPDRWVTPAA